MRTFASVLEEQEGVGPGFGLLRMLLAVCVIFVHCSLLDGAASAEHWWPYGARWALNNFSVPMFFVMSGFLVTASVRRTRFDQFLVNRLVRILPGLAVVVLLSAFVLGPLMTTLPAGAYFRDHGLSAYLLNLVGLHRDVLPGLFTGNSEPSVNGSLWTLPHEITCYLMLSVMAASGWLDRRRIVLAVTVGLYGLAIVLALLARSGVRFPLSGALDYIFVWRGAAHLVPLFLTGVLFQQYRDRIPYSRAVAAAVGLSLFGIALIGNPDWQYEPAVWALTAPLFAYLAIFLGLSSWFALPILVGLDYSYGIFLYGFPVQQTLAHLMAGSHNYPLFFVASVIPAVILGALSWHLIEKPSLKLRRRLRPLVGAAVERLISLIQPGGGPARPEAGA